MDEIIGIIDSTIISDKTGFNMAVDLITLCERKKGDEVTMIKGVPTGKDMVHLGQLMTLLIRKLEIPGLSSGFCTLGFFFDLNAQFPIAK